MFKKSERVTKREFTDFFATGKRHHFPLCSIITLPFPKRKVAVVVSKKVVKSAVKRNLIKRRVFAVLHNELSSSNYKGVLLVIVKPAFATLSRKQAAEEFRSIIAQVIKSA
ncbi:MAG: ribonuclease P protein component [Candidatus Kaiserbacteria bacterium]|nr:ribonuclease P protein component [Candidatus Kaiserbacteria bacterium]MCB9816501.1 ribonuclease P protein component [Candidatus Nomurabacteria bacterium]